MESALEEIEFLALSPNRVEVLQLLSNGTYTRKELAEQTDVSQATLGRILGDFQDRSWVKRVDSAYTTTSTGSLVCKGFTQLMEMITTEQQLRGIAAYLPEDEFTFDIQHLADTRITTPTRTRPNAPLKRLLTLIDGAARITTVSHAFNEETLTIVHDLVTNGDTQFNGIFSRAAISALQSDEELSAKLQELVRHDRSEIAVTDDIPLAVMVADEAVCLLVRDTQGVLRGAVDSENTAIYEWAQDTFSRYRQRSDSLSSSDLLTD
ncbi:ArsR family transcriptional regulator [Salinarchaeum sp. IM2453]|uniref:helix-turn-helix transcriptional regulator n=1 Tax=Salinarchaeum sp. IM2453 TaxID=2862870 RepID=UPI001C833259|nr:ArsR family transcriptional regulator [Salinarchaeum sp. IM2453]QZA88343.1 ArsR family transcriptional regulator [Salinarchaeum sp. IM2453]